MIYGSVEFTTKPFGQEKKKFADFTLDEPAHSPKQEGGADCGILKSNTCRTMDQSGGMG